MKPARETFLLIEQTEQIPGLGKALLVTVVAADAARVQVVVEHHVFLPDAGVCANQTSYPRSAPRAWKDVVTMAREETRRLLVTEAARHAVLVSPGLVARGLRQLDPATGNPFVPLAAAGVFEQTLWEIQEWTSSPPLRVLLAQAVCAPAPVST